MRKRIGKIIGIFLFVLFCILLIQVVRFSPLIYQYFFTKEIALKTTNNRVNILLLGIGGGTHDGPNLTDSIIFASIDPEKDTATLVSIPRDLWVPELKTKINAAYAAGEEKQKGGGILLAKAMVSRILHQPIDYTVRIDFDGFVKAVDLIGGLDVTVDQELDDYTYPVPGKETDPCGHTDEELTSLATDSSKLDDNETFPCRYKHLHFDIGKQHMDGKTALEFVRSRHALGAEGSDFARSKRQAKIIAAFKQKVLSYETLLNPVKIISLYNAVSQNIDTDIPESSFDDFLKLAQKMKSGKINSIVIDEGDEGVGREGLLIHPPITPEYENSWALIPRVGNGVYTEIQSYVACVIKGKKCVVAKTQ